MRSAGAWHERGTAAEWDEHEQQLAAIRCQTNREQIVRIAEVLWRAGLELRG